MSILYWISTSRCSRSATNSKEEGEEGNGVEDGHESDKNIEIWKIKKLIKALESARGNGTSMISLIMPPGDESGTASNIKSTVNGQSVLGAIRSTQRRIKLYNKVPPSGLVLYTRTIITADGRLPYCQTPFPSSPLLSHSREGRGCHHTNQSLFTLELHGIIIIPRAASSAVSKLTRCSFLLLKGLLICAVQGPRSSFSSLPCTYCSSKCSYINTSAQLHEFYGS